MNLLLHRSSAVTPMPGTLVTLSLASGALALMLLIASEIAPRPSLGDPAPVSQTAVRGGELTLFEQVRHEVVTGA